MSLFDRHSDLPGIKGTIRDCTNPAAPFTRLSAGDIAIVDAPDMPYALARRLVAAQPAAVVNVSPFVTGVMPIHGPLLLADAGITLIAVDKTVAAPVIKDGKKGRLSDDGDLFYGTHQVAAGKIVHAEELRARIASSNDAMLQQMKSFFADTVEFMKTEAPMIVDGFGVPVIDIPMAGRKVLVVAPGPDHRADITKLRNFIREYSPVLIGVDAAADSLVAAGYTPDVIVGHPDGVGKTALTSGARIIIPADPDGHAGGVERLQDVGVGALTFPALSQCATDLALTIAHHHQASVIVLAGDSLDLSSYIEGRQGATASAWLTRLALGDRLVGARSVEELYNMSQPANTTWLWLLLGLFIVAAVVIAVAGLWGPGSVQDNLHDNLSATWQHVADWFADVVRWARSLVS